MEKYISILNFLFLCGFGALLFEIYKKNIILVKTVWSNYSDIKIQGVLLEGKIESLESKIDDLIHINSKKDSSNLLKKEPRIKRKYTRKMTAQL